jgi:hypothetical protein
METDRVEPNTDGFPEEEKEDRPFWKFW